MAIVIQCLSQSGQVLSQEILPNESFTLGRGYYCEHHIDDPYVCEEHAKVVLSEDKRIALTDQKSVNGTLINGKFEQYKVIEPEDIIVLGRSRFRIFLADKTVAATKKLNKLDLFLDRFNKKRIVIGLLILFVALTCLETYLFASSEIEISTLLTPLIGALTLLCLPVFAVSLLAVLNKKESRLLILFNLVLSGFVVSAVLVYVFSFLTFNIDNAYFIHFLSKAIMWVMVIVILYVALYVAFRQSTRKRLGIVAGIVAIYAFVQYMPQMFDNNDFIGFPHNDATVMTPSLLFNSAQSTEGFIADTAELFKSAEQEIED